MEGVGLYDISVPENVLSGGRFDAAFIKLFVISRGLIVTAVRILQSQRNI